jgi:hypothetical protein
VRGRCVSASGDPREIAVDAGSLAAMTVGASQESGVVRFAADVTAQEAEEALALLGALRVRSGPPARAGQFDRSALRTSWYAMGWGIGLSMKDVVLAGWIRDADYEADGFTVRSGLLSEDPYTGAPVVFRHGDDPVRRTVDLDHVVSLRDAWESGGWRWSPRGTNWQRLYNHPVALIPTSRESNLAKGDKSAAGWLPEGPAAGFRSRFAILQVLVKSRFRLSVTEAEGAALRGVLEGLVKQV